jgi:osmotically-inducible protein OsmY
LTINYLAVDMKRLVPYFLLPFISGGCSTMATDGAEVFGLSSLHDRRSSRILRNDERIETNAGVELNSHAGLRNNTHFTVTAYNGKVLITGEAPTAELRDKIVDIVRRISGVKLVHNEMVIAEPSSIASRSHDTVITTKVKSSLSNIKNLPGFDATRVKVVTENGVVYLMGLLYRNEAHVAAEMARRESGVKQVVMVFEYLE